MYDNHPRKVIITVTGQEQFSKSVNVVDTRWSPYTSELTNIDSKNLS